MNNKRILIFTGGNLGPAAFEEIQEDDVLVGVDRGALHLIRKQIYPHICLGDFDSVTEAESAEIEQNCQQFISCDPIMKDLTDTEMAFNWAIEQRPRDIWVMGGVGTRFDHSLANAHLLMKGLRAGITCCIRDEHNEIRLVDKHLTVKRGMFTHISLLPLSLEVSGISLNGFRYPLEDATISIGDTLGISNTLEADFGEVKVESGYLLVIQSRD
ncbi:thiamine diphosphokinase [Ammoniphilus oxalaticus]|uniref:Thiamine diphosphokinase n=1 Tax=Ammoniphilus oxalaticus TaxID=66863 RepID=A0A419SGN9_9BACL|nr:thiamine diphosphokinase [Ammoniphilus oxalaticus]RKD22962.1 thiamine diphosphokinase [Ammoniphilus oxalaticus]